MEFLLAFLKQIDVHEGKRRHCEVEEFEMLGVLSFSDLVEVAHNHPQVVTCVHRLLKQVLDAQIEHLHAFVGLACDSKFEGNGLKLNLFEQSGDVLDNVGVVLKGGTPDESDVSKGVTDVGDQS